MNGITGQASIVKSLRRAAAGAAGQAYVFTGEKGMGKKTIADAFAKALQCEAPVNGEPCGVCRSCRLLDSRNHPDIFYVRPTKTKSIGVDDVREQVKHPIQSKPFQFKYKIFIADEAEAMSVQAQNALLKIIEEPPGYGVFMFLAAHLHTLLPTVLSRCVVYKLKPLTDSEIVGVLSARGLAAEGAVFAGGNPGRAIEMASSESFAAMSALVKDVMGMIRGADALSAMALYKRFEEYKDSAGVLLNLLYMAYTARGIKNRRETVRCADAVVKAKKALERNGNFQLIIELMLIELSGGYNDGSWCAV